MSFKMISAMLLLVLVSPARVQPTETVDPWKAFDFLVGAWTWNGGGQPGQGLGSSTFRPELNGTVLVRRTHLDYPATPQRAAFGHDDLIYVYRDPPDSSLRAMFFDNEGHVIRYAITVAPDGNSVRFLSDAAPAGTTCRMTYARVGSDTVTETFEIAPPGKPEEFKKYVEFTAKRVGP